MDNLQNNNSSDIYNNASAFRSDIPTSFNDSLAKSIMDLVQESQEILMSDIIQRFGAYSQVHNQIKRLILDNKLVLYETSPNSILNQDFHNQKISMVDQSLSQWLDMAAQPCLTCATTNECAIGNPVSPATCDEFNVWLVEEIELFEFDNN